MVAVTPIDVIKTRIQLEPKGTKFTMASMAKNIIASEGPAGLLTGFGPTAVGYLIQGGAKFSGYEYFKRMGVAQLGGYEAAKPYKMAVYIGASAAAEVVATTLLTPLEAARIRLVSERGYAKGLIGAITRLGREQGFSGFYGAYGPILLKQIPFTIGQLTINTVMHEWVNQTPSLRKFGESGAFGIVAVQLGCGTVAGIGAAILSHPGDTLLSKMNKSESGSEASKVKGSWAKLKIVARETGPVGIWAGLGPRTVMTVALVASQFMIYDAIKRGVGAPKAVQLD